MIMPTINGLLMGTLYTLAVLGFSMIFGVLDIINIAHGELIMLGSYLSFYLYTLGNIDPFFSIFISIPLFFLLGFALQKYLLARVPVGLPTMLLTFGLSLAIVNLALLVFKADYKMVSPPYASIVASIGSVRIQYLRLGVGIVAIMTTVGLNLLLKKTKLGRSIRATSMDREAASILGVNASQVYAITFGICTAITGVAGVLASMIYAFSPTVGVTYLLKAFVITIVGGRGSITSALVVGLAVGLAESYTTHLIGSPFSLIITVGMLIVILVVKPEGIRIG